MNLSSVYAYENGMKALNIGSALVNEIVHIKM